MLLLLLLMLHALLGIGADGVAAAQPAARPPVHSSTMCALPPNLALPGGAAVHVAGDGATAATLHRESAFELRAAWGDGRPIRDAVFQARLVGPTMLAAAVRPPQPPPPPPQTAADKDNTAYAVTYTVHDPGTYVLEVRVSWLTGASLAHLTLPLKTAEFLNTTTHVDCVVYRRDITVVVPSDAAASESPAPTKPLCRAGNRPGRWVKVAPGAACPPHACVGSAASLAFLDDLYGFNRGWVWSPHDCNYRIFSVADFEQCLVRKNVSQLGFIGDSLLREHFQNIMVFLQQHVGPHAKEYGSKANDQQYNLTLPGGWRVLVDYHLRFDDRKYDGHPRPGVNGSFYPCGAYDAHIWNVPLLKFLVQSKPPDMLLPAGLRRAAVNDVNKALPRLLQPFEWLRRRRWAAGDYTGPRVPTVYYLHPRIQREDLRIVRDTAVAKIEGFAMMTPPRQDVIAAEVLRHLPHDARAVASHGATVPLLVLDGLLPTEARWEATWDGAHYTMLVNQNQLAPAARCGRPYSKGGRNLCGHLTAFPGTNRCINTTTTGSATSPMLVANSNTTDVAGRMEFCRTVVDRSAKFTNFEGGVSRMLTMMWMNMMCNDG